MTKAARQRVLQHFPIGAIAALVQTQDLLFGQTILWTTLVYEAFNDWRKHDSSYIDVLGIVWGYGFTAIGIIIVRWLI